MSQIADTPNCPHCQGAMALRNGRFGNFYGCRAYPKCRGTMPYFGPPIEVRSNSESKFREREPQPYVKSNAVYEPMVKMPGSAEQEAIWDCLLREKVHLVVNALAGSGKTFTAVQGCLRAPRAWSILFLAFNKHISTEAQGKLRASGCSNVRACTYHSLGYSLIRDEFPGTKIDNHKITDILEALDPLPLHNRGLWRKRITLAKKLTNFARGYMLNATSPTFRKDLELIADHHDIEFNGNFDEAYGLVAPALEECKKRAAVCVDYDDMIWLPLEMQLPSFYTYDLVITDESQDLNQIQHDMAFHVVKDKRMMIVGDTNQAIYGFRGSHTESMEMLTKRLHDTKRGAKEFPLTITRRCPRSHVQLVQSIVPGIRAMDNAPEGEILSIPLSSAVSKMEPGDLVMCRVNGSLITVAYDLIRRGVKPIIRGRALGDGLLDLLTKLEARIQDGDGLAELTQALMEYRYEKETKLLSIGDKAEGRLIALREKCDCMLEFISNSKNITEMRGNIETIFSEFEADGTPKNAVVLGTIHRTKGLEAERVFVLSPELIPHPMSKKEWAVRQEGNLAYIAGTRAKYNHKTGAPGTLIFCGTLPGIYGIQEQEEEEYA